MRVYRQRIRSVRPPEDLQRDGAHRGLPAVGPRQRVLASAPYTHALTGAVSAVAGTRTSVTR